MKTVTSVLVIACLTLGGAISCKSKKEPEPSGSERASEITITQYYYDREIADSDIKGYNLRELSIARNTIFARAGHVFTKKWLYDYFAAQPWYAPSGFDKLKLSKVDLKNAKIISQREAGISREELIKRRDFLNQVRMSGKWNDDYDVELGLISHALGETVEWDPSKDLRNPLEDPMLLGKLISVEQIEDVSRRDLRILRNMIFARHGRKFKSVILQEYFNRMSWYTINPDYSDDMLTDIDKKNIRIILSVETSHGGPLSEEQHAGKGQKEVSERWFSAA